MLGFWYGLKLKDEDQNLTHGTNKKIFYKIFNDADQIDIHAIVKNLKEDIAFDINFKTLKNTADKHNTN